MTPAEILDSLFPAGHAVTAEGDLLFGHGTSPGGRVMHVIGATARAPIGIDQAIRLSAAVLAIARSDDDAPILDTSRQRLEALRILARHLGKRVRVEPDRGSLDVVERPLLREQAGDIVLGGKPAANHDLTESLAGATPFIERIVELHLREEPSLNQQLTQRDPNGSLGRIGSGQGLLTHSLILRCCDLSPNPPDICRRIEPQT